MTGTSRLFRSSGSRTICHLAVLEQYSALYTNQRQIGTGGKRQASVCSPVLVILSGVRVPRAGVGITSRLGRLG